MASGDLRQSRNHLDADRAGVQARYQQSPPRGKVVEDISKTRMIPKGTDGPPLPLFMGPYGTYSSVESLGKIDYY